MSSQEKDGLAKRHARAYFTGRNERDELSLVFLGYASAKANSGIALECNFFSSVLFYIPSVQNFECKGEMIINLLRHR